jgi:PPK2 family polyphosphate:nucleotide phosphotransferase
MTDIQWTQYLIKPSQSVHLSEWDPSAIHAWKFDKDAAEQRLSQLNAELDAFQELLYAQAKHKVLIVLQGMDTSGKDGVIRKVFEGVNPQGVRVASFKVPTAPELAHDYLWRVHPQAPASGEMVIFNRSHYEDVLVVRVHNLVLEERWQRRYEQINQFERLLTEEGTTILKFFLHIDAEEQRQRLLARLDEPAKRWKFSTNDLKERQMWGEYQQAYEAVLNKTSQEYAPWIIVPANRKWYRDLIISAALVDTLKELKMEYPQPIEDLEAYRAQLSKK